MSGWGSTPAASSVPLPAAAPKPARPSEGPPRLGPGPVRVLGQRVPIPGWPSSPGGQPWERGAEAAPSSTCSSGASAVARNQTGAALGCPPPPPPPASGRISAAPPRRPGGLRDLATSAPGPRPCPRAPGGSLLPSASGPPPPRELTSVSRALPSLRVGVSARSSYLGLLPIVSSRPPRAPSPQCCFPLPRPGVNGACGAPRTKGGGTPEPFPLRVAPLPGRDPIPGSVLPLPLSPGYPSPSPPPLSGSSSFSPSPSPSSSPSPSLPPHNAVRGAADMAVES